MITHFQETWKIQNKVTYSSTIYYSYFLSRRFFIGVSISNCQKLLWWIVRKAESYSRPEKDHEPINTFKIYAISTQEQGTNPNQVLIDYKPGDTITYPGT